ncbi:6'''-hydroxyparomomycin C oxidase [Thiorhodovibrio winogradskyi]|uniref:6'''-hydroxyparomomycin C oxidase n=1 Tax=Thiorhodovibrio winogradskyi TaxID=77007 RepID=A0ABZ0SDU9_9GAMM|nr:GMC family oxidoreductase [Thiorhodovibrio winogradskyi]
MTASNTDTDCDVCIIGSGAGGSPVAWRLAKAGQSVIVLEKGPWLEDQHFRKDELACCRRAVYTPEKRLEPHVVEDRDADGAWVAKSTAESGWDFWNGNLVGGSSNLMSGFFHRLKPVDFRQLEELGPIAGANRANWPIGYADLEPYYDQVERLVGISGAVTEHPNLEPRSSADFPYPPTLEHPVSAWIDDACERLGYHALRVPRAILSRGALGRRACEYSGYCGSFGCSSGAKGGARAAWLTPALATGRCDIRPRAQVLRLLSDARGRVTTAEYADAEGKVRQITAKRFVVACQAVETSRLLLNSPGPKFPNGLANNSGQVGRNLLFSAGGSGSGDLEYAALGAERAVALKTMGPFVNRALDDWYLIEDKGFAGAGNEHRYKGGIVEFLLAHPNPTGLANRAKWRNGELVWGLPLKRRLEQWFRTDRTLRFEVFCDWLPTDDCFVSLDPKVKDRWGQPVARIRIGHHPHDLQVGRYLADKAERVLKELGAARVRSSISGAPPPNLMAGGCRFGTDPKTSVLDADCRAHEVENLFVTDGSFMPTGGSVPYTWTIYANALRVAEGMLG